MEVDAPLAQHNSDNILNQQQQHHYPHHNQQRLSPSDHQSEASMNFDYLQDLRAGATSSSGAGSGAGAVGNSSSNSYGLVDDSRTLDRLLFHPT